MSNAAPVLEVAGLTKHFRIRGRHLFARAGVHALDGVSLSVGANEIVGIVGESGCGKSTLARCIVGLEQPTAGTIWIAGIDALDAGGEARIRLRRAAQMVFQDPYASLNPRWTTEEVLAEPLRNIGVAGRVERRDRAAAMLERVGLSGTDLGKYPAQFSGGQRQRIGIARALLMEPQVVIGDEPVSALDMSIQAQILNLLLDLHATSRLAIVLISHDLELVERMCETVHVMYLGRVVESGPAAALFGAPQHPYTPHERRRREVTDSEPPNPTDLPPGCRYHTRCPLAQPICREVEPMLRAMGPGRMSACHLAPLTPEAVRP